MNAVKEIAATITGFAESFTTNELVATNGTFQTVKTEKLCLGSRCMTAEQFNHLLDMEAAAGAATAAPTGAPAAIAPSAGNSPTSVDDLSTLNVNGNNPSSGSLEPPGKTTSAHS